MREDRMRPVVIKDAGRRLNDDEHDSARQRGCSIAGRGGRQVMEFCRCVQQVFKAGEMWRTSVRCSARPSQARAAGDSWGKMNSAGGPCSIRTTVTHLTKPFELRLEAYILSHLHCNNYEMHQCKGAW